MTLLLFLQLILPLALAGWFLVRPMGSWVGLTLQVLALICLVSALHLSGLWLMPPWWTVWIYWLLLFAGLVLMLRRMPTRAMPGSILAWAGAGLFAGLAAYAGWTAAQAWMGRQVHDAAMVRLGFPLRDGSYLVANGGTNTSVSTHARTFARATARQRLYYGQSHAVDLVALNRMGFQARGFSPAEPDRYEIFGHPVVAPCGGSVVQAADDYPDMRVPIMDAKNMAGNHVLLRCSGADILLAHLRRGSIRVRPGQRVAQGQIIGQVGNSGNSGAPHLHIHAQEPGPSDAPFSGRPLPMAFDGRYLVRGDRVEASRW